MLAILWQLWAECLVLPWDPEWPLHICCQPAGLQRGSASLSHLFSQWPIAATHWVAMF